MIELRHLIKGAGLLSGRSYSRLSEYAALFEPTG